MTHWALKPNALAAISFMLLYRLGEAQLSKIAPLFMLDSIDNGGLGLSNIQLGFINGTIGLILLTLGGILGGFLISKQFTLKRSKILVFFIFVFF